MFRIRDRALVYTVGRHNVDVVTERGRVDEQVAERAGRVLERVHAFAQRVDLDDLERAAGREQLGLDARDIFGNGTVFGDGAHPARDPTATASEE